MKYTDSVSSKFQQYSSPSWRNAYANAAPNKFVDYQDPTYIGFYVRFYGTGPDGLGQRPAGPENVVGLDEWPGGLFLHEDHPNSAVRYLKNIGEYTRAQMLREFISGIKQVSEEMPWYFTKVTGLEEVWKINPMDSYRGKEKKVTFDTLESIDLKITYLLDLYRKAVFDSVYMRYMLPENLRYFDMDIVVTEIRNFHRPAEVLPYTNDPALTQDANNFKNPIKPGPLGNINIPGLAEQGLQNAISAVVPNNTWASGLSNSLISAMNRDSGEFSNYPVIMSDFDNLATFLVFSFGHCEFDAFSEAPTYFGSLEKVPNTVAANKMTINTHVIREFNTYGLLGSIVQDTIGSTDRIKDEVDSLFWKKVGVNLEAGAAAAPVPAAELAYLNGIKMEFFNTAKRFSDEKSLRAENARLGGLLGGLLNTAIQIGSSALNNVIQGAVSKAVLGNALESTFGSTISDDIATQIILASPEIVPAILTNVVFEANGASISNNASQAAVDLDSPVIAAPSASTVFLTGPSTTNTTPGKVSFEAPVIGGATLTSVTLEAPEINTSVDPMVILSAPPVNAGLSGSDKVDLEAPNTQTNDVSTVMLEAPLSSENTPGSVKLEGAESSEAALGEVAFEEPTISSLTSSSVEFSSVPADSMMGDKVELKGAESNTNVPRNVELEAPNVQTASSSDKVSFDSPQTESAVAKSVELTGTSDSGTNPGSVQFEEAAVNGIGKTEVEFVSTEIAEQNPGVVQLDAPPSIDATVSSVVLEAHSITTAELGKEDLIAPTIANTALGEVPFEEPKPSETTLSNVNLTGALPSKVDLDTVTFDGAKSTPQVLNKVDFNENENESPIVGKVNLESPSPQKTELGEVKFDDIKGGSINPGTVPLDAPPIHPTALGNSMDGVDTQQDKK